MAWTETLAQLRPFSGEILFSESLAKHTYFKIGGPAAALAIPKSTEDLITLGKFALQHGVPIRVLGLGSNILARDEGFDGLLIKTTRLLGDAVREGSGIRVGAGIAVAAFLRKAANEGWDGFALISGIPGTLGGVVAMNGGTHLGEAADLLLEVRTLDLAQPTLPLRTRAKDELSFSYRKNHFLGPLEIVIDSLWRFQSGNPAEIREKLDALFRRRKDTQPLDFPSCGSVFRNPSESGLRAWEVIDRLGLRGHRIGNAQFAEKHPNWILNLGDAQAHDVLALIELAKKKATAELGITLTEEVRLL